MRFRKKPVTIEAERFDGETMPAIAAGNANIDFAPGVTDCIAIQTLEGVMVAWQGDWIIKGVKGEFYPCKPDIFAMTYEHEDGCAVE